jgi:hypothetical protein
LVFAGGLASSQSDFPLSPHDSDSMALTTKTDDPTITSVFMDPSSGGTTAQAEYFASADASRFWLVSLGVCTGNPNWDHTCSVLTVCPEVDQLGVR